MNQQFVITWKSVMDSRYNPLKHMDLASSHYLMQVLAWMWSMIFSLSFLSIYYFSYVWLGHLLVIGGVFLTMSLFERAESVKKENGVNLEPVRVSDTTLERNTV